MIVPIESAILWVCHGILPSRDGTDATPKVFQSLGDFALAIWYFTRRHFPPQVCPCVVCAGPKKRYSPNLIDYHHGSGYLPMNIAILFMMLIMITITTIIITMNSLVILLFLLIIIILLIIMFLVVIIIILLIIIFLVVIIIMIIIIVCFNKHSNYFSLD